MLGLFKGRSKDKLTYIDEKDNKNNSATKEDKNLTLKRSKSQEKCDKGKECKVKDKGKKDDKFSRFSFKRNKSYDKKRGSKDYSVDCLNSESSTPSLSNGKDVQIDLQSRKISSDDTDKDESESQTSSTISSSEANSEKALGDSTTSISQQIKSSSVNNLTSDKSENNISISSNIISEKFLHNSKTYPRKVPVYEQPFKLKNISLDTYSSSHLIASPSFAKKINYPSPIIEKNWKIIGPSTHDGSLSMLSTPSSSTSSLCSINGRPISPSGRRTPPGPKLGTGGRIPSSPTPMRKTSRTNIKTNPIVSGRRTGSISPSNNVVTVPTFASELCVPTSRSIKRNDETEKKFVFKSPELLISNNTNKPIVTISQTFDSNCDLIKQDNIQHPPLSPSLSPARTRNSLSSMQSLESIPEIDNDLSSDKFGGSIISAKGITKKINPKSIICLEDENEENVFTAESKEDNLFDNHDYVNSHKYINKKLVDHQEVVKSALELRDKIKSCNYLDKSHNERNHIIIPKNVNKTQQSRDEDNDEIKYNNLNGKSVLFKKPPLVSKRSKENGKLHLIQKEETHIPSKPLKEGTVSSDENAIYAVSSDENAIYASLSLSATEERVVEYQEENIPSNNDFGKPEEASSTHFIFHIPLSSPDVNKSILRRRRASSLEIIPNNKDKHMYKEDIFPKSSLSVQSWPRPQRCKSPTRVSSMPEGIDVKLEIPITIEELKKQAADLATTITNEMNRKESVKENHITKCFDDLSEVNNIDNDAYELVVIDIGQNNIERAKQYESEIKHQNGIHPSNISDVITDESTDVSNSLEGISQISVTESQSDASNTTATTADEQKEHEMQNSAEDTLFEVDQNSNCEFQIENSPTFILTNSFSEPSETTHDPEIIVQQTLTIQIEDKTNNLPNINSFEIGSKDMNNENLDKYIQTDDDSQENVLVTQQEIETCKKELSAQELKYQQQVDDLSMKLAEKQQEVTDLVEELKEASEKRSYCSENLEAKVEELKLEVREKEAAIERMKLELQYAKNESALSKTKMRRLEDDLSKTREVTNSLQEQNSNRAKDTIRLKDLELKLKNVEEELRKSEATKKNLKQNLVDIEAERDEEMKIVQDALDEAAQEREELIATFEKELQHLNKTNTAREQQMMEDFEWKLREMEKEHKKKVEEKEKLAGESLNAVRSIVESELAESLIRVAEDKRMADEKLSEVGHLRSYEAEVIQLRGVTHEFQKALRASAREMENLKIRERLLEEEIRSLKTGSQSRQNTLQRVKRHTDDEEARQKLEKMRNELNAEWEDKLRTECSRLKAELDELHSEEKHLAVESMKVQKEQDIQALKKSWELRNEEMAKEISTLKDNLTEKDGFYHKELDTVRTNADRDIWDLRMKLSKLNEACFDQKQQLEEKHRDEKERSRVDYEDRIQELERRLAAWDAQAGVDLVAELEKEHKEQLQHIEEQHKLSMERLREESESERFQAVEEARVIITKHHEYLEANLREQLAEAVASNSKTKEEIESIRQSLAEKEETIRSLREELDRLQDMQSDAYSRSNYSPNSSTYIPPNTPPNMQAGLSSSQYSLDTSHDSSLGSRNSQDRYSLPETTGVYMDDQGDNQKASSEQERILDEESQEDYVR